MQISDKSLLEGKSLLEELSAELALLYSDMLESEASLLKRRSGRS